MTEKLKKLTNVSLIILGILILSGFIFGLYWYINQGGSEDNTNDNTQPSINSKVEDLGNGWMKYTNYDYGLSFEYPEFWTKEDLDNVFYSLNTNSILCLEPNTNINSNCKTVHLFLRKTGITGQSISTWYDDLESKDYRGFGSGEILERDKMSIDNLEAWKLKIQYEYNINIAFLVFNFNNNYVFDIHISESGENNEVVQKIMSTLSFN